MKKKVIVTAIAAAIAAPTVVHAEATMYGKVRVATQYHSRDTAYDSWGMEDQTSRIGVKGSEDLGNGLKGVFQLEFGVNVGDGVGKAGGGGVWNQRNSFVGLAGPFGTILAGRHDTPLKLSTMKLDFFSDTNVDNDDTASFVNNYDFDADGNLVPGLSTKGIGLFDSIRVDGAIAYVSPNFAGVTLMGAIVQTRAGADFEEADAGMGAYSLAATYSNGPWFASAAYESLQPDNLGVQDSTGLQNLPDYNKWRLAAGVLDFNNISASFIYEDRSDTYFTNRDDTSSWQFSAAYDIMGMFRVKGMYGQYLYNDNEDVLFDTWAVGLVHKFSKRTDVQVLYRQKNFDDVFTGGNDQDDVFAVQLDHAF